MGGLLMVVLYVPVMPDRSDQRVPVTGRWHGAGAGVASRNPTAMKMESTSAHERLPRHALFTEDVMGLPDRELERWLWSFRNHGYSCAEAIEKVLQRFAGRSITRERLSAIARRVGLCKESKRRGRPPSQAGLVNPR